jgi:hypothetical protein
MARRSPIGGLGARARSWLWPLPPFRNDRRSLAGAATAAVGDNVEARGGEPNV